jgi:hypothetical protein
MAPGSPGSFIRDDSLKAWNISSARLPTQGMMQPVWIAGPRSEKKKILVIKWNSLISVSSMGIFFQNPKIKILPFPIVMTIGQQA